MMDDYEATKIVYSRVQNLDPENASKIMGILLLQDHGEKEMIRLAFGPEALIHSIILKARNEFNLNNPTSSISRPRVNLPSLSIPPIPISNQPFSNPDEFLNSKPLFSKNGGVGVGGPDFVDEFQIQDHLSFLTDCENPDFFYPPPPSPSDFPASPTGGDMMYGGGNWAEEAGLGLGWRPCLYYARGFCKNGSGCRFFHSGGGELGLKADGCGGGRAEMVEQCNDLVLLRSKSGLQQRLGVCSSANNINNNNSGFFPYSPAGSDLLLQQQQNEMRRYLTILFSFKNFSLGDSNF